MYIYIYRISSFLHNAIDVMQVPKLEVQLGFVQDSLFSGSLGVLLWCLTCYNKKKGGNFRNSP